MLRITIWVAVCSLAALAAGCGGTSRVTSAEKNAFVSQECQSAVDAFCRIPEQHGTSSG
jgi:hypothetical protein